MNSNILSAYSSGVTTAPIRFWVLGNGKLRLPKIDVPVRWSRPLPSQPSSVTVIKDPAGRYFASFVIQPFKLGGKSIGTHVTRQ